MDTINYSRDVHYDNGQTWLFILGLKLIHVSKMALGEGVY